MTQNEKEFIDAFAMRVKSLRKSASLTQEEISDRMDIDDGSYRRIEGARTNPTLLTLRKLAIALNVSLEDLVNGISN